MIEERVQLSRLGKEPVTVLALTKGQVFFHGEGLSAMNEIFQNDLVKLVHAIINVVRALNFFFTLVNLAVVNIFL